jgi:hypothetical protein
MVVLLPLIVLLGERPDEPLDKRSPPIYFPTLSDTDLQAHYVPTEENLRDAPAYREFLAARRSMLSVAMTELLDRFQPPWLKEAAEPQPDPLAGFTLDFTLYQSDWDAGKIVATANYHDAPWTGTVAVSDLTSVLDAAADGLDSDIKIGSDTVPVHLDDEEMQIQFGPFLVTGTVDAWRKTLDRELADALPLSQCPAVEEVHWDGDPAQFPVTSAD